MHCLANDAIFPKWYSVQEHYYTNDTTYIDTKGLMVFSFSTFWVFCVSFFLSSWREKKTKANRIDSKQTRYTAEKNESIQSKNQPDKQWHSKNGIHIVLYYTYRFFRIFRLVVKIVLASTIFFVIWTGMKKSHIGEIKHTT